MNSDQHLRWPSYFCIRKQPCSNNERKRLLVSTIREDDNRGGFDRGHSSATRALIIPLIAVGLFFSVTAGVLQVRNTKRLEQFKQRHEREPAAFVQAEKERVDEFSRWYRPLLIGWSVLMLLGLGLFHLWGGSVGRAVGIGLVLLAARA